MIKLYSSSIIKNSLINDQIMGAVLILTYCAVYGLSSTVILSGLQMMFFLCSMIFAVVVFYIRDPDLRKARAEDAIFANQVVGTILLTYYILVFGISSLSLLSGFQLVFFMSSYVFAMSIFYIRDQERIENANQFSCSFTGVQYFTERTPCQINKNDLSWFVREVNSSLSILIGFSELMLNRQYSEMEKEYMMRNIYQESLNISNSLNKVSGLLKDVHTKPREIHDVVDLLADKNFKN